MAPFTASRLFIVLALAIFLLAAFGVTLGSVALLPLGLAVLCVSYLVP